MKLLHLRPLWKKVEGEGEVAVYCMKGSPILYSVQVCIIWIFFFLLYASFILVAIQEAK